MNAARKTNQTIEDWHPADVVAALKKKGTSLAEIERQNGYARTALSMLWTQRWPKAQELVAKAIGVKPSEIWPSRYDEKGAPLTGRVVRIPCQQVGCNA